MPLTGEGFEAARLLDAIDVLPLAIDDVACAVGTVEVPTYPGGCRPSAIVTLTGTGTRGVGEHVAWSVADHERFARVASAGAPRGHWRLGEWAVTLGERVADPYVRAALEGAALDLALRQAGASLFGLVGRPAAPVRYVVSFDRREDPVAEVGAWRAVAPHLEFKVDADPAWDDAVYAALAHTGAVVTVDFKGGGRRDDHERAHRFLPHAWIEDPAVEAAPWSASTMRRLSFDGRVTSAAALDVLPAPAAAINEKPARQGGVLGALR